MDKQFIIQLNGLDAPKSHFEWQIGKEFFNNFKNEDILDANLKINVMVEKSGDYLGIDCNIEGSLTVTCDRCLDDLIIPVDREVLLSVKFSEEPSELEELEEGEREIIFLDEDDTDLNLSQVVYDYSCLCIPLHKVHDDGECNPEIVKYLGTGISTDEDVEKTDNPFASLKKIIKG